MNTPTTQQAEQQQAIRTDDSKARRRFHHELKSWPDTFGAVLDGTKRHEVRKADRDYADGDTITLKEFIPDDTQEEGKPTTGRYTGREWHGVIRYISVPGSFGLPRDLCCFTIAERFQ